MYQHYKSSTPLLDDELLLRYAAKKDTVEYQVLLVLTDDFVASVNRVTQLHSARNVEEFDWSLLPQRSLTGLRNQTTLFNSAYSLPVRRKMEDLSKQNCVYCYAGLFVSHLRPARGSESALSQFHRSLHQATPSVLLATLSLWRSYDLPLEYLIGIGAMENNYTSSEVI
jgi:hypothetical protein